MWEKHFNSFAPTLTSYLGYCICLIIILPDWTSSPSLFSQCCILGDVTMKLAHITPLVKTFQILDIKAKVYTMTYLICLCAALYPTPHSQALGSIYSLPWALWLQPQWPFLKPLSDLHYYPEFLPLMFPLPGKLLTKNHSSTSPLLGGLISHWGPVKALFLKNLKHSSIDVFYSHCLSHISSSD